MIEKFKQLLGNIERYILATESSVEPNSLLQTYHQVTENFDRDYARAKDMLSYIFVNPLDVKNQTQSTVDLLDIWANIDEVPSMTALNAAALSLFGIESSSLTEPVLMASLLGDIPNHLEYHSTLHFRKVVLHSIRMIVTHNHLFKNSSSSFNPKDIVSFLAAAAIHDFGHTGTGNIVDRIYTMAMTEIRSYDLACPYLRIAGFTDEVLADIRVMLITTDASPFGDPMSPSNQLRAVYEYHFGSNEAEIPLELSEELQVLEQRSDLCLKCMMLHEADIMNSAGVHYDITRGESVSISKEIGREYASPEDTLLFLDKICCGTMMSDAAQYLANDNLAEIQRRVLDDYRNGNKSYM